MTQPSPSQYKKITTISLYGVAYGLYHDITNSKLCVFYNDAIVFSVDSTGAASLLDALTVTASTANAVAIKGTGNGTGAGVWGVGGSTDGVGGYFESRGNGIGLEGDSAGSGDALYGYATGSGAGVVGDSSDGTGYGVYAFASAVRAALRVVPQGADPSGASALGDFRVNAGGELRRCITAGTPGKFAAVGSVFKEMSDDFNALATTAQVPTTRFDGVAFTGATGVLHHLYAPSGNIYGVIPKGAGQTLAPAIVAAGLDIGGDQTSTEGYEIFSHFMGATGRPFRIGTDPAFYFKCKFQINDADGLDTLIVGFRRAEAQQAAYASYADYAGLGLNTAADPMAVKTITEVNGAGTTVTDTTQTLAQATAVQFKVLVSAAGVVTYQHDIVTPGTLAAPVAAGAFTFDTDDPVIPFFNFLNSANLADAVIIHSWEAGYQ